MTITDEFKSSLRIKIPLAKTDGYEYQKPRHPEWTENYTLYRDKVTINRLTQRQSVNVPMMKGQIRTILSKLDDPPDIYFDELSGDDQKELFFNEQWIEDMRRNKMVIQDHVDKKQGGLYGRSFKSLDIRDGQFYFEITEPWDILVSRYNNPVFLESSYFLIHQHIFKTLAEIMENDLFDDDEKQKVQEFYKTKQGVVLSQQNTESLAAKNERLKRMGVTDVDNPTVGQTIVELNYVYMFVWDDEVKDSQIIRVTTTDTDNVNILSIKTLEEIIGKTKDNFWRKNYPYSTWATDIERANFWSDGDGDVIRTPNKIANSNISQQIENRTLRNFGMFFYNSMLSKEGYAPQTFEPGSFRFYPTPGNPRESLLPIEIPELTSSMNELNFIIQVTEKATAATSSLAGVTEERKLTLGEIEIADRNANQRINSNSVLYNDSWQEFALKYLKMMEAAANKLKPQTLYKKSPSGKMVKKELKSSEWRSSEGYAVRVTSRVNKLQEAVDQINKLNAVVADMPNNKPLKEIKRRKLLKLAELDKDEIKEVLDFQKKFDEDAEKSAIKSVQPTADMLPPQQSQMTAGAA